MSIQTSPDTLAAKAASAAQWGGSAVAGASGAARVFGLTTDEWTVIGIIAGIVFAAAGFVLTWIYKQAHLRLARERLDLALPDGD
jgi:hypothetical protein